jgi:hypothetical protein
MMGTGRRVGPNNRCNVKQQATTNHDDAAKRYNAQAMLGTAKQGEKLESYRNRTYYLTINNRTLYQLSSTLVVQVQESNLQGSEAISC